MDVFFGGGGGVKMKRETWQVVAYILPPFTTFYKFNFVMSYFCWGGGP